jgi:hypothetical protein
VFINKSKIHFESKSQQVFFPAAVGNGCLSISQRYILKANHNFAGVNYTAQSGVYQ